MQGRGQRGQIKLPLRRLWIWIRFYLTKWLGRERVLVDGLAQGMGRTTFRWRFDPRGHDGEVTYLIQEIDGVIRGAPTPRGIADFLIRVQVFGPSPDRAGWGTYIAGRYVLLKEFTLGRESQDYLINRYTDWAHGDARNRLEIFLRENEPQPGAPLLLITVISIGSLLTELADAGKIDLGSDASWVSI